MNYAEQFLVSDMQGLIGAILVIGALGIVLFFWIDSYLRRRDEEWRRDNPVDPVELDKQMAMHGVSQEDRNDVFRGTKF